MLPPFSPRSAFRACVSLSLLPKEDRRWTWFFLRRYSTKEKRAWM